MWNTDTQAPCFKESPKWLFTVPRKWGAFQWAPCLLWYLSTCWRDVTRRPLGSLRWRISNSSCQASINIPSVYCPLCMGCNMCCTVFFAPFGFAVSVWLVEAMLCDAPPVWSGCAQLTRWKAGLHVAHIFPVLFLYAKGCQVSAKWILSFLCLLADTHGL